MPRSPTRKRRAARSAAALLALCAVALATAACGRGERPEEAGADAAPVRVVVSVPPLAWFVERIGAEAVSVTVMVPPGASPALYDPTFAKMRAVSEARLYVAVGHPRFPFESAWLDELVAGRTDLRVVRSGAGCATEAADPHLWLSPACAREIARAVADALTEELPGGSDAIVERREALLREIGAVEAELAAELEPYAGRSFLVFHPALGYLARAYGLQQLAIQRGASEPGPAEVAAVVREARERGIHEVFVQPQFSSEAAAMVAGELPDGRVVTVDPLSSDWPSMMRSLGDALAGSFRERPRERP